MQVVKDKELCRFPTFRGKGYKIVRECQSQLFFTRHDDTGRGCSLHPISVIRKLKPGKICLKKTHFLDPAPLQTHSALPLLNPFPSVQESERGLAMEQHTAATVTTPQGHSSTCLFSRGSLVCMAEWVWVGPALVGTTTRFRFVIEQNATATLSATYLHDCSEGSCTW